MNGTITEIQDLTREDYERIRKLVYEKSGINLGEQKMQLVRARLGKVIRQKGLGSFRAYYEYVCNDASGEALCGMLDAISTNTTHLFRENHHFKFLGETVRAWAADRSWRKRFSDLRIWSAACSSGEEPYSIAMTVHDALQGSDLGVKILATDISTRMLARASQGMFEIQRVGTVPAPLRQRYLRQVQHQGQSAMQVVPEIRQLIQFSRFNLMSPTFPFRKGFNVVFCRNVMIYFDRPTQQTLVNKFAQHLHGGGFLLIGHSESLNNLQHPLSYVEPTVYRK